jgi:hypothetical protein
MTAVYDYLPLCSNSVGVAVQSSRGRLLDKIPLFRSALFHCMGAKNSFVKSYIRYPMRSWSPQAFRMKCGQKYGERLRPACFREPGGLSAEANRARLRKGAVCCCVAVQ